MQFMQSYVAFGQNTRNHQQFHQAERIPGLQRPITRQHPLLMFHQTLAASLSRRHFTGAPDRQRGDCGDERGLRVDLQILPLDKLSDV